MARTVPVTSTESPGNYITGALWNAGPKALGDFTLAQPVFTGYQATTQTIPSGTWTAIGIDTGVLDSDGGHSNTSNNTRYFCQVAGVYLWLGMVAFVANTTGVRGAWLQQNGTTVRGSQANQPPSSGSVWSGPCWAVTRMAVGDTMELAAFQNSGAGLNTQTGTTATCCIAGFWLAS